MVEADIKGVGAMPLNNLSLLDASLDRSCGLKFESKSKSLPFLHKGLNTNAQG